MTTLATGPVDETLDRAANLIAEAADRADGRLDVAPDPEVVAQVRGRMKYTIEQVQLGTQNGGPAR
ncbi:hypothetical protein ACWGID_17415 [Kribbella sp. NPDC054772]